jgi:tRNA(fMet)-specific endonuclease VapC
LSQRFMLDTNTVSYVIKGRPPEVRQRLTALPMNSIVISAITQAELLHGLARKGKPANLARAIQEFVLRVQVLPWDGRVAQTYGDLRASCEARGVTLDALDMMIAAHAIAAKATLITHDQAFSRVSDEGLVVEDWVTGS